MSEQEGLGLAGRKAVPRPSGAGAAAVAAARREVLAGQTVDELGTASRKFAPPAATEKARLLQKCSTSEIRHPRVLIGYHDCLLFLLAYPQTAALREAAEEELGRVATVAGELSDRASKYRRALEESGIAWSEIRVELSYPMARWLADRHPRQADVGLFGDEGVPLQSVLALSFGELEETLLARQRSSGELLEEVARDSGQSHLEWLVLRWGGFAALRRSAITSSYLSPSTC